MIWREATHEVRLLVMSDNSVCSTHSDANLIFLSPHVVKNGFPSPSPAQPNPAIFYVDSLSNEVAKEKYTVRVPVPLCDPRNPALGHDRHIHQLVNGTTTRYVNRGTDIIYLKNYNSMGDFELILDNHLCQMEGITSAETFNRFAIDACHFDHEDISYLESNFNDTFVKCEMLFVLAGSKYGSGENGAAAEKIRADLKECLEKYEASCCIKRFKWVENNEDLEVYEDQYGDYDIEVEDDSDEDDDDNSEDDESDQEV